MELLDDLLHCGFLLANVFLILGSLLLLSDLFLTVCHFFDFCVHSDFSFFDPFGDIGDELTHDVSQQEKDVLKYDNQDEEVKHLGVGCGGLLNVLSDFLDQVLQRAGVDQRFRVESFHKLEVFLN